MQIARFVFRMFGINTYAVWDKSTRKAAIIDPGMSCIKENNAMASFLSREQLTVTQLINTHLHIDHVCGNGWTIKNCDVTTSANPADAMLGSKVADQAEMFGLDFKPEGVEISTELNDGDEVKIGNGHLKVLHVPGHSPGSIALYDSEGGFVISGDAIFAGSIGRTDLPGGSMPQLISSIRSKLLILPDNTVVYPGHGEPTTIGNEKLYNPYLK